MHPNSSHISMRILFICGCLQPAKDGVGDYVRSLAESCILQGNECAAIALNDPYVAQTAESVLPAGETQLISLRLPSTMPWSQRIHKCPGVFGLDFNPIG